MRTWRILDLCCCAGGAGKGYAQAGFEVVGVDIDPQPNYPFEFWQMDALTLDYEKLAAFDVIHASPPCQNYSRGSALARKRGKKYPDLVDPIRRMLYASGKPYIIENVLGAPVRPDICLCGSMFGLGVMRHRYFETNISNMSSGLTCQHEGTVRDGEYVTVAGRRGKTSRWADAMGIDWMNLYELKEAIPPAFTQHLGELVRGLLITDQLEMRTGSHEDLKNRRKRPVENTPVYSWSIRLPGF